MVQLTFCRRGIATIIPAWTLSIVVLISATHFNKTTREETEQPH